MTDAAGLDDDGVLAALDEALARQADPAPTASAEPIAPPGDHAGRQGMEPYYPVNNERNNTLAEKYRKLAEKEANVIFGGRLGQYRYYDMATNNRASIIHEFILVILIFCF